MSSPLQLLYSLSRNHHGVIGSGLPRAAHFSATKGSSKVIGAYKWHSSDALINSAHITKQGSYRYRIGYPGPVHAVV